MLTRSCGTLPQHGALDLCLLTRKELSVSRSPHALFPVQAEWKREGRTSTDEKKVLTYLKRNSSPDYFRRDMLLSTLLGASISNFSDPSIAATMDNARVDGAKKANEPFVLSSNESSSGTSEPEITRKVFFDVSIDGNPAGRIVIGVYGKDVPIGANRFAEMAIGRKGVSFRRNDFVEVLPNYILHSGVRSFNITGTDAGAARFTGGETADPIAEELARVNGTSSFLRNVRGSVSLVAVDPTLPPPKQKLVARGGSLEYIEEEVRPPPNGSEFAIVTQDSPGLDSTNLVVGKVLEGWSTIETIGALNTVKENSSSLFFMAGKMAGDKRAVIAERGFNRPYAKVTVTKCGEL